MRNLISFLLPPRQSHDVLVAPALLPTEQPTILTFRKSSLVMEQLSNEQVRITNTTEIVAPVVFCVIDRRLPSWIGVVKQLMGGT